MLNSMKDIRNKALMSQASGAGQQRFLLSIVWHCSAMLPVQKNCAVEKKKFCGGSGGASTWQCSSG